MAYTRHRADGINNLPHLGGVIFHFEYCRCSQRTEGADIAVLTEKGPSFRMGGLQRRFPCWCKSGGRCRLAEVPLLKPWETPPREASMGVQRFVQTGLSYYDTTHQFCHHALAGSRPSSLLHHVLAVTTSCYPALMPWQGLADMVHSAGLWWHLHGVF